MDLRISIQVVVTSASSSFNCSLTAGYEDPSSVFESKHFSEVTDGFPEESFQAESSIRIFLLLSIIFATRITLILEGKKSLGVICWLIQLCQVQMDPEANYVPKLCWETDPLSVDSRGVSKTVSSSLAQLPQRKENISFSTVLVKSAELSLTGLVWATNSFLNH